MPRLTDFLPALLALVILAPSARADEPFRYPEATHGLGELRYINELPVLIVAGSPEEIGAQWGALALKPATPLLARADEMIDAYGWKSIYELVRKTGNVLLVRFSPESVREIDAAVAASGWPRELLAFGNTVLDLRRIILCSALLLEGDRTTTGEPMFGRNLDWPPFANFHEYSLVIVYRPDGKRAFASITCPGMLGCPSGMNDAGLALAMLDAVTDKDGSPSFNPAGVPTLLLLRQVMEECATIDEAVELIRSAQRASSLNLALCDRERCAIVEITPNTLAVREADNGAAICTNHFRTPELATEEECWRFDALARRMSDDPLSVADVAERLHAVNQEEMTLQSMIFEPAALRLHLAIGKGPATALPMHTLDLAELFKSESE
jgi:isopenicillin-N N-acyltransferase like protein